jgi:hypothetical protein
VIVVVGWGVREGGREERGPGGGDAGWGDRVGGKVGDGNWEGEVGVGGDRREGIQVGEGGTRTGTLG